MGKFLSTEKSEYPKELRSINKYGVCENCKAIFVNGNWYRNLAYASDELGILTVKKELIK